MGYLCSSAQSDSFHTAHSLCQQNHCDIYKLLCRCAHHRSLRALHTAPRDHQDTLNHKPTQFYTYWLHHFMQHLFNSHLDSLFRSGFYSTLHPTSFSYISDYSQANLCRSCIRNRTSTYRNNWAVCTCKGNRVFYIC